MTRRISKRYTPISLTEYVMHVCYITQETGDSAGVTRLDRGTTAPQSPESHPNATAE